MEFKSFNPEIPNLSEVKIAVFNCNGIMAAVAKASGIDNPDNLIASVGFSKLLPEAEWNRARNMMDIQRQRQFCTTRVVLRNLLAKEIKLPSREIGLCIGKTGKPALKRALFRKFCIHFSLGHSDEYGVVAVSRIGEIGIDIQRADGKVIGLSQERLMKIEQKYFRKNEISDLNKILPDSYLISFFRAWSLKEALAKARGDSVFRSLKEDSAEILRTGKGHVVPGPEGYVISMVVSVG